MKVTREVRQSGPGQIEVRLSPGDTIFPLYHQGEGFWQVWQDGGQRTVDIFWPWEYWRTPADYEFSGEVIQEVVNEFWTSVSTEEGVEGWVSAGWSDVIIPVGQIPPYECPVGSS